MQVAWHWSSETANNEENHIRKVTQPFCHILNFFFRYFVTNEWLWMKMGRVSVNRQSRNLITIKNATNFFSWKRTRRSRLNVCIACGKLLAAFSFACGPYFSSITPTNQLYYAWNVHVTPEVRAHHINSFIATLITSSHCFLSWLARQHGSAPEWAFRRWNEIMHY